MPACQLHSFVLGFVWALIDKMGKKVIIIHMLKKGCLFVLFCHVEISLKQHFFLDFFENFIDGSLC
jgi:hypothetical protein